MAPSIPDLNLVEDLWALLKGKICVHGEQYTSLNSVWAALISAAQMFYPQQITKPRDSMEGRLITVINKKGGCIGH